jgi:D-arabinose 1-dehydrogenase-like Zn-dependent alcohol dehydrogenase
MPSIPRRGVAVSLLLLALVALLAAHGTVTSDPTAGRFPGNDAVAAGTITTGDRVVVAGTARGDAAGGTRLDLDGGPTVVVRNLDADPGADVWLYGTYDDGTIRNDRAVVRAPWEITYLYAVSALGGVFTFGRALRTWRVDTDRWVVVPREGEDG